MKITKTYLKTLIKESLEEIKNDWPREQVTQDMIQNAIMGREDYIITQKFAKEIVEQHHIPFEECLADLGDNPTYKVSKLFSWLGY